MKKTLIIILSLILFSCKMIGNDASILIEKNITVAEKVINSIVIVNDSSGVVVKADDEEGIILTAYHNISSFCEDNVCNLDKIKIMNPYIIPINEKLITITHVHPVVKIDTNPQKDIAIIKVKSFGELESVDIGDIEYIKYGNSVWVAGNPTSLIRSLKKGVISSPVRKVNGIAMCFEFDAGVIYGNSGGGVFDDTGKLIGIVESLRSLNDCTDYGICVSHPITMMGFAVRIDTIKKIIQNGEFCEDFNMCL